MKRIIKLVALLEGQKYGMKTMKSFLIALVVMGTATFATVNVVLNEKAPFVSNTTLQNLEAFTEEAGESGVGVTCNCSSAYCGISTICTNTIYRDGRWVTEFTGSVCCCGTMAGYSCTRVTYSYVMCNGVSTYC
jgi:hypothetical protein